MSGGALRLHALITGYERTDHINLNALDNRRVNLRNASNSQNMANGRLRINNKSGYKGVTWFKRDSCWRAQITVAGVCMHLGYYADPVEAALAYDESAKFYFGEFAKTNVMLGLI